jgi:hypothetical protein
MDILARCVSIILFLICSGFFVLLVTFFGYIFAWICWPNYLGVKKLFFVYVFFLASVLSVVAFSIPALHLINGFVVGFFG